MCGKTEFDAQGNVLAICICDRADCNKRDWVLAELAHILYQCKFKNVKTGSCEWRGGTEAYTAFFSPVCRKYSGEKRCLCAFSQGVDLCAGPGSPCAKFDKNGNLVLNKDCADGAANAVKTLLGCDKWKPPKY